MSGTTLDLTGLNGQALNLDDYAFAESQSGTAPGTFTVDESVLFPVQSPPGFPPGSGLHLSQPNPGLSVVLQVQPIHGSPGLWIVDTFQSGVEIGNGNISGINYRVAGWNSHSILLHNSLLSGTPFSNIVISDRSSVPLPTGGTGVLTFGDDPNEHPFGLPTVTCFAAGTVIATPSGGVAVEELAEGDLVRTLSGAVQPIGWIGCKTFDCERHPNPGRVMPVQIDAGAFGVGLPSRALMLSPEHAVFADGVMIPVRCLVNGTTIRQQAVSTVTYYHLELPRHDVVFAEGLPAETYLDTGNRRSLVQREAALAHAA